MAIRSIPNCLAMVTAIARPRALNEPVGKPPLVLDQQVRARRCSGSGTIGVSGSPRLTGSPSWRQQLAPFPHARRALREAVAGQRPLRRLEVVADQQRLARARQVVDLAGFIALAGQRAFEMGDIGHQQQGVSSRLIAFDLERAMLDPEAVVEHAPRGLKQRIGGGRRLGRDEMRGQRRLGRAQRPDVKVVHRLDARRARRVLASTSSTSMPSGTPTSDIPTDSRQQPEAAPQDHHRDREAHHRVDPLLTGPQDDQAGEDHRGRDRGVGRHVLEGGADIDVVLPARARTARR